jgi:hypothetical protein
MSWNYRVVHFKNPEFEEDDYYEIKEVFYDSDGKPVGFSDALCGSDTYEGLFKVAGLMNAAHAKPVINEEEFYGDNTRKES